MVGTGVRDYDMQTCTLEAYSLVHKARELECHGKGVVGGSYGEKTDLWGWVEMGNAER